MIAKEDGWSIVLAGHWNRMIFTPEWVGSLLFDNQELETLVAIMPNLPLVYRTDDITFNVSAARLAFQPRRPSRAIMLRAEEMARKVLTKLDDTPLTGVGVNFEFRESDASTEILDLFNFDDNPSISEQGWELRKRSIFRRLQNGDDALNLTIAYDAAEVSFAFNYHADTTTNAGAVAAVTDRVCRLHDTSLTLLDTLYHLRFGAAENE